MKILVIILLIINIIIFIDLGITEERVTKLEAQLDYLKFRLKDFL